MKTKVSANSIQQFYFKLAKALNLNFLDWLKHKPFMPTKSILDSFSVQ